MTKRPSLTAHDEGSERAALGAMLIDGSQWADFAAAVKREDVFLERNKVIYDACQELQTCDQPIDLVTLSHQLNGRLDLIGGPAYLQGLINECPIAWNWPSYAAAIVESSLERRRAAALLEASRAIERGDLAEAGQILIAAAGPEAQQPQPAFTLHWASEALQPQPPIDWIIGDDSHGLLTSGSVGLMAGDGGIGKTFVALDLCVAKAMGRGQWLGFALAPGPVLLIDEESGDRRLKRRLADVIGGHDAPPDLPLAYTTMIGLQLLDPAGPPMLEAAIKQSGARLVVVDSLIDVIAGSDENTATELQPAFHSLRILAEKFQCGFLVLDHTNRAGSYRGTSHKKMAVDLLIIAERGKGGSVIEFNIEKARDIEPLKFGAVLNFAPGAFNLSPATLAEKEPHWSKGELYVIRYLKNNGGKASLVDIAQHADSVTDRSAKNAARALVEKGITERIDEGGMGESAVYGLTGTGRLINV